MEKVANSPSAVVTLVLHVHPPSRSSTITFTFALPLFIKHGIPGDSDAQTNTSHRECPQHRRPPRGQEPGETPTRTCNERPNRSSLQAKLNSRPACNSLSRQ
jgi:hypothetical protein